MKKEIEEQTEIVWEFKSSNNKWRKIPEGQRLKYTKAGWETRRQMRKKIKELRNITHDEYATDIIATLQKECSMLRQSSKKLKDDLEICKANAEMILAEKIKLREQLVKLKDQNEQLQKYFNDMFDNAVKYIPKEQLQVVWVAMKKLLTNEK